MANFRYWLTALIAFLLISSIVGHYVGEAVSQTTAAGEVVSAETHLLHTSSVLPETQLTPQPSYQPSTLMLPANSVNFHSQPPPLPPPIVC